MFHKVFSKNRTVWNVEIYCRARQATDDIMVHAHCMLDIQVCVQNSSFIQYSIFTLSLVNITWPTRKRYGTPSPCFMPFYFNASCQFIPLLLWSLTFSLTSFGLRHFIALTQFLVGISFMKMVWTCSENGRGKIAKRSDEMVSTRKKKMR
jgi:hypothetical protein